MCCDAESPGASAIVDIIYLGLVLALFLATVGLVAAVKRMESES
jgi:hypothetical protein